MKKLLCILAIGALLFSSCKDKNELDPDGRKDQISNPYDFSWNTVTVDSLINGHSAVNLLGRIDSTDIADFVDEFTSSLWHYGYEPKGFDLKANGEPIYFVPFYYASKHSVKRAEQDYYNVIGLYYKTPTGEINHLDIFSFGDCSDTHFRLADWRSDDWYTRNITADEYITWDIIETLTYARYKRDLGWRTQTCIFSGFLTDVISVNFPKGTEYGFCIKNVYKDGTSCYWHSNPAYDPESVNGTPNGFPYNAFVALHYSYTGGFYVVCEESKLERTPDCDFTDFVLKLFTGTTLYDQLNNEY